MMPEPKFVTNSPLPFVFKIDVSCKDKKEFGEGGNVRLPKLPFEDGRIYGEDEEEVRKLESEVDNPQCFT